VATRNSSLTPFLTLADVIEHFRKTAEALGTGYQTMINSALRVTVTHARAKAPEDRPLTAATLRKILREELLAP
jgi:hypothetical protein